MEGLLRNFFQPYLSLSLAARRPRVRFAQFFDAASVTADVASKSTPPAPQLEL